MLSSFQVSRRDDEPCVFIVVDKVYTFFVIAAGERFRLVFFYMLCQKTFRFMAMVF